MSIEEKIEQLLQQNGMFPDQAKAVMARVKDDEANSPMSDRWGDSADEYPPVIISLAWLSAKHHAIEWIDENLPKAWFRPMFV
jgi:hypothetical protein